MTVPAEAAAAERSIPTQSLAARIVGVLRRPSATFGALQDHPRCADVLIVTTVAAALAGALLMQTEVGRQALVDQWERTAVAFGQPVDDARYAELERLSESGGEYAIAAAVLSGPVLTVALAALIFVVARRAAPQRSFRQVLAVTAHAGVVLALRQVIAAPIGYLRESTASATSLGVWFSMLDEVSAFARFLGLLDIFVLWWAVTLAIGVGVLLDRRPRVLAVRFVGTYLGLALLLAGLMAILGDGA